MTKSFRQRLTMAALTMVIACVPECVMAQTLKGTVTDAITGETLIGAAVKVVELPGTGGVTNMDGEFSFNLSQSGRYTIETSYIGYEPSVLSSLV